MMTDTQRVWFITGCSSGFGRAYAEAVIAHGDRLVATARNVETLHDLQRWERESLSTNFPTSE